MKERSLVLRADEVRGFLEGRKSQLRRVVRPQPENGMSGFWHPCAPTGVPSAKALHYANERHLRKGLPIDFCPFGAPGDRLWVREAWALDVLGDSGVVVAYRASCPDGCFDFVHRGTGTFERIDVARWRSPIHMPRWASRLMLELEAVRVQRLWDISNEDAWAEGCTKYDDRKYWENDIGGGAPLADSPRDEFAGLWNSTAKPGFRWEDSPWVWALTVRRVA